MLPWWRVVDLHAGFGKIEATTTATTSMPQYQNNPIANAVDGNAESKFFSSRNTQHAAVSEQPHRQRR